MAFFVREVDDTDSAEERTRLLCDFLHDLFEHLGHKGMMITVDKDVMTHTLTLKATWKDEVSE